MKNSILLAALLVAACTTVPDPDSVAKAVTRAVAAEGAAAARCALGPMSPAEWQAVTTARLFFDTRYGALASEAQRDALGQARGRTNQTCGAG